MRSGSPVAAVLSLLLMAGCGGESVAASTTGETSATPPAPDTSVAEEPEAPELAGTGWTVTNYALDGSITNVWPDTVVTIGFDETTVSGSTGCNSYGGPYAVDGPYDPFEPGVRDARDGQEITFGPLSTTKRACAPDRVMEQEAQFLGLLSQVERWLLAGDTLLLRSSDGGPLVEAERAG